MAKGAKLRHIVYIACIGLLLYAGLFSLNYMKNSMQEQIVSGSDVPFTIIQVENMMRYHGATIARFDGKNWWFLKGKNWINITNGNAIGYTQRSKERSVALEGTYRHYKGNGHKGIDIAM